MPNTNLIQARAILSKLTTKELEGLQEVVQDLVDGGEGLTKKEFEFKSWSHYDLYLKYLKEGI